MADLRLPNGKRLFGNSRDRARSKRRLTTIISRSYMHADRNNSDDGNESDLTMESGPVIKEEDILSLHPAPTRAGTSDPTLGLNNATQTAPLNALEPNRALLQISPKLTILNSNMDGNGKLSFVINYGSPTVWVLYHQVNQDAGIKVYLRNLSTKDWEEYMTGGEKAWLEPADLGIHLDGQQIQVTEVHRMKKWDGRMMLEISVSDLVLDEDGVHRMGLVEEAAQFLHENAFDIV
ncbi:unnamed protein product [Cyclocybe aegerita]|uniref:Uncharacterized protein n=1 Tax=Cyclocybe aegerita TaxID=1973307 RepID=A0A8S0VW02_CYCAE|nr:unnamed protein product [Cyclocybe aegerita]